MQMLHVATRGDDSEVLIEVCSFRLLRIFLVAGRWSFVARTESGPATDSDAGSRASFIGRMNPPLPRAADADGGDDGIGPVSRKYRGRRAEDATVWPPTKAGTKSAPVDDPDFGQIHSPKARPA
jgi:hypothetical protein